jgi:hypothetical protein
MYINNIYAPVARVAQPINLSNPMAFSRVTLDPSEVKQQARKILFS